MKNNKNGFWAGYLSVYRNFGDDMKSFFKCDLPTSKEIGEVFGLVSLVMSVIFVFGIIVGSVVFFDKIFKPTPEKQLPVAVEKN